MSKTSIADFKQTPIILTFGRNAVENLEFAVSLVGQSLELFEANDLAPTQLES